MAIQRRKTLNETFVNCEKIIVGLFKRIHTATLEIFIPCIRQILTIDQKTSQAPLSLSGLLHWSNKKGQLSI